MLEAAPDKKTQDGLPATFATNIFGHFMVVSYFVVKPVITL